MHEVLELWSYVGCRFCVLFLYANIWIATGLDCMWFMIIIETLDEFGDLVVRGFLEISSYVGCIFCELFLYAIIWIGGCESAFAFSVGSYGLFGYWIIFGEFASAFVDFGVCGFFNLTL